MYFSWAPAAEKGQSAQKAGHRDQKGQQPSDTGDCEGCHEKDGPKDQAEKDPGHGVVCSGQGKPERKADSAQRGEGVAERQRHDEAQGDVVTPGSCGLWFTS